jgi:hypothetical protein
MTIIFEPQCYGFEHVSFNSSFLKMLLLTDKDENFLFVSEKSHFNSVKDEMNLSGKNNRFSFFEINKISRKGSLVKKFLNEFFLHKKAFQLAKKYKSKKIIFSSVTKFGLLSLSLLTFIYRKNVFVIPHSILEDFINSKTLNLFLSVLFPKRVNYIVLGEAIKENFLKFKPKLSENFFSIDMPYIYKKNIFHHTPNTKLNFSFLGVGHKQKGIEKFLMLYNSINEDPKYKNTADFTINGHIPDFQILTKFQNTNIKLIGGEKPVSMNDYIKQFEQIDFAIFLHDKDSYNLRASGVFFDAINFNKPIISLRNTYFEYYFKKYGDIGYLCNDLNEVINTIKSLLINRNINYKQQQNNIAKLKKDLTIKEIAKKMCYILNSERF